MSEHLDMVRQSPFGCRCIFLVCHRVVQPWALSHQISSLLHLSTLVPRRMVHGVNRLMECPDCRPTPLSPAIDMITVLDVVAPTVRPEDMMAPRLVRESAANRIKWPSWRFDVCISMFTRMSVQSRDLASNEPVDFDPRSKSHTT